jgi:hypothetical protein
MGGRFGERDEHIGGRKRMERRGKKQCPFVRFWRLY